MFFPLKTAIQLITSKGELLLCEIEHAGNSCLTITNVFKRTFFISQNISRCADIPIATKMFIDRNQILGYSDIDDTHTMSYINNRQQPKNLINIQEKL